MELNIYVFLFSEPNAIVFCLQNLRLCSKNAPPVLEYHPYTHGGGNVYVIRNLQPEFCKCSVCRRYKAAKTKT